MVRIAFHELSHTSAEHSGQYLVWCGEVRLWNSYLWQDALARKRSRGVQTPTNDNSNHDGVLPSILVLLVIPLNKNLRPETLIWTLTSAWGARVMSFHRKFKHIYLLCLPKLKKKHPSKILASISISHISFRVPGEIAWRRIPKQSRQNLSFDGILKADRLKGRVLLKALIPKFHSTNQHFFPFQQYWFVLKSALRCEPRQNKKLSTRSRRHD